MLHGPEGLSKHSYPAGTSRVLRGKMLNPGPGLTHNQPRHGTRADAGPAASPPRRQPPITLKFSADRDFPRPRVHPPDERIRSVVLRGAAIGEVQPDNRTTDLAAKLITYCDLPESLKSLREQLGSLVLDAQ